MAEDAIMFMGNQGKKGDPPEFKVFTALQRDLGLGLVVDAFEPQHHLLGRLGLLPEHRLRLAAVAGLLAVVSTLALREERGLHPLRSVGGGGGGG